MKICGTVARVISTKPLLPLAAFDNSFIYRIYAKSPANPFIYRIYAKRPGVGVHSPNFFDALSSPGLCLGGAPT
jgi:hypothetical protein